MSRAGNTNQYAAAVIIDGVAATDLGDEFAYRVELPDTSSSLTIGTQGAVVNYTTNKTATLHTSVLPQSKVNDQIAKILYNQQHGRGREIPIDIITTENTKISCRGCSVRQGGGIEGGGQAGVSRVTIWNVIEFIPDKENF